jgi:tetratricopeptide (TPR) repeat protein
MRFKALLLTATLALCTTAQAQFFWPEDPEQRLEAQTLWTLFDDYYGQGDYEAAKPHLEKIIDKDPSLSTAVYINAIKVWKDIYKNEKDTSLKAATADRIMQFYELRFKNFPEEKEKVIDRQAIDAFQFYYKDASKTQDLLDLFQEAYSLQGNNAGYALGRYYMNTAALAYARNTGISDEEILKIYDIVTRHIDFQTKAAKDSNKSLKRYIAIKEFIDDKLVDLNLIDCEFIVEKLVPDFEQNPMDAELANKIFVYAYEGGCTDAEWFVAAAERVFESDPQYGVAYLLGARFGGEKNFDRSKEYFLKASEVTDDNTDKAKAIKQVAVTERIQKNYVEAKKYALQAAAVDPTLKEEMYTLIGDMIMGSLECDEKESQVDDRARYILAYEYYMKGGNTSKARSAGEQFPTMGDIFTANKEEGQSIFIGCWIQESVKLKKRDGQ